MERSKGLILAAAFIAAPIALAHPGHGGGLAAGVAHPVSGIDHVLAMVAVGLLAAQTGSRAIWMLPLTFVSLMLMGGVLSLGHAPVPLVEQGIMASVLVLGVLVAMAGKVPMFVATGSVGLFAVFHGYAHVTEMRSGSSPAAYAAGFIVATILLHAVGLGVGQIARRSVSQVVSRIAGASIAVCGLLLFTGIL